MLKMVHIKVTNGIETRRFQVTEELPFEQLREKLSTIFSSSLDQSFQLQYVDSDGDVITISSDEELQSALSGLSSDAILKLYMKRPALAAASRSSGRRQSLFEGIFGRSTNFWDHFEKQFNVTESILEQLWGNNRKGDCCTTECCDSTTDSNNTGSSNKEVKSKTDTVEPTDSEQVKSKVEEPVKSKPSQTESSPQIPSHTVVSWEPRVQYTWFGPRTVLRPVRYNVLYLSDQESSEKTVNDQAKTTPELTPQETAVH